MTANALWRNCISEVANIGNVFLDKRKEKTMATRDKSGKCRSGKHKYKSFTEAMIGATIRRVEGEGRYYPNAYRCKFCKRYHMTKGKKIEH